LSSFSLQLVRLGVRSLAVHKLRSVLAVLGIVFGVGSVVSMLAIGEGASHTVQEDLRRLGPDRIIIRSVRPEGGGRNAPLEYGLTDADLRRIEGLAPELVAVAPTFELKKEVWVGHRTAEPPLVGTTPQFADIHRLEVARGRFLSWPDIQSRANVAVIGNTLARQLFGADNPIGRELKLGSGHYRIVGLLRPRSDGTAALHDPNASIFLPLSTAKMRLENVIRIVSGGGRRYEHVELHQIALRARRLEDVPQIAAMIRRLLEQRHPARDYELVVPYELLQQAERAKRIFSLVLGSIGGISLLVGGIGIMNIMLATVIERTQEIGVRRALGAKRWHITVQFLVETVILATAGGLLGVALGVAIPPLVTHFSQVETVVTPWSLAVSLAISTAVGILFGLYPARRAALMDPIEALRHE
jgi:putative ABC transport system permease protein